MKNLIIIIACIILGLFIFNLIASDEDESLKSAMKGQLEYIIQQEKQYP